MQTINTFITHGEWAATAIAGASQVRRLSPKSYHIPSLQALVRTMSLRRVLGFNPKDIDQDIYTQYAQQHRKYLEIGDVFYNRPWLDSLYYLGAAITSTPNYNFNKPENYKLTTGWKQVVNNWIINPEFQYDRYIPEKWLRRSYGVNLLWLKWFDSKHLLELGLNIQRSIDLAVTTGFLTLTWNSSNGRGYRDFNPNRIDFLDLKNRAIPSEPNNIIEEVYATK